MGEKHDTHAMGRKCKTAIQTDTNLVIVKDGLMQRITPSELREQITSQQAP